MFFIHCQYFLLGASTVSPIAARTALASSLVCSSMAGTDNGVGGQYVKEAEATPRDVSEAPEP